MAVRGVRAAAVVGVDGEYLSGESNDPGLLERMVGTVTSALAAGEALAGLLDRPTAETLEEAAGEAAPGHGERPAAAGGQEDEDALPGAGQHQLMVMYQDGGPILFTPLPGGARLAVVALSSSHDVGRARFQLRGLTNAAG